MKLRIPTRKQLKELDGKFKWKEYVPTLAEGRFTFEELNQMVAEKEVDKDDGKS